MLRNYNCCLLLFTLDTLSFEYRAVKYRGLRFLHQNGLKERVSYTSDAIRIQDTTFLGLCAPRAFLLFLEWVFY